MIVTSMDRRHRQLHFVVSWLIMAILSRSLDTCICYRKVTYGDHTTYSIAHYQNGAAATASSINILYSDYVPHSCKNSPNASGILLHWNVHGCVVKPNLEQKRRPALKWMKPCAGVDINHHIKGTRRLD